MKGSCIRSFRNLFVGIRSVFLSIAAIRGGKEAYTGILYSMHKEKSIGFREFFCTAPCFLRKEQKKTGPLSSS